MKTQNEVAKSAEMCVIGAILIDEKALAAGDPAGLVALKIFPFFELASRGDCKFAENGSQFCAAGGR